MAQAYGPVDPDLVDPPAFLPVVAIIGGGLTGCEIAYELALEGKHPFIVEMLDDLVKSPGVCAANSSMLRDLMAFHRVPVYLESSVRKIEGGSVTIETKDGTEEIPADSVIASVGYNPGTALLEKWMRKGRNIHVIGDANSVGNLKTVIAAANDLVLTL